MTAIRAVIIALFVALTAAIVWASATGAILEEGGAIAALPWGIVTLADLYSGFILSALAILAIEPRRRLAIGLAASVFVLGNIVPLAWVALRWRVILDRLRPRA
jgi:hypothetical protein